jgi:glycosyltransferase involved in cell wall biosynthesis
VEVDAVIGELIPYGTAGPVSELARRLRVPWIADLQDPWALDEMWLYPSAVHRLRDRRRMRSILRTADAVVMNTPQAATMLREAFPEFAERRVLSIPNGFDAEDFAETRPERVDDVFRIVHSGYLHTDLGLRHRRLRRIRRALGGMPVPSVDYLTRSHVFLLRAVDRLLRTEPDLDGRVEVDLLGVETPEDREVAATYPFVRFHGYRSHGETIAMLQAADLAFLPMQDLPSGVRAGLVPGKTYEYLASGTPILAAVPDGDARDILAEAGNASICRPADVDCLTNALRERVAAWRSGTLGPAANPDVLVRFERRRLAASLAAVVRDVVDGRSTGRRLEAASPEAVR